MGIKRGQKEREKMHFFLNNNLPKRKSNTEGRRGGERIWGKGAGYVVHLLPHDNYFFRRYGLRGGVSADASGTAGTDTPRRREKKKGRLASTTACV